MAGIRIRHLKLASCVALVPILSKPLRGMGPAGTLDPELDRCPSCHLLHPVKTVHLWLDDAGSCIVSEGVLKDLRLAGMPELELAEEVKAPPALTIGVAREQQDHEARRLIVRR